MSPKISIIIPVYNVEKYLRQCLDSVVNQTLRELQVICVDHTSTDSSRAILEEFASGDSRIQIVDCPNTGGGPGQARNAGIPHIQGTYTYFVDSDDWLDVTLCEKACTRMDETNCDILFLDWHVIAEKTQEYRIDECRRKYYQFPQPGKTGDTFLEGFVMQWTRILRTSFIREHSLCFIEGCLSEDTYFHWVQMVSNPHIEIINEKLYFYRLSAGSLTEKKGEYVARMPQVYTAIREYLEKNNRYSQFKEKYLIAKVMATHWTYHIIQKEYRKLCKELVLQSFREDEITDLRTCDTISPSHKYFLLALTGRGFEVWKYRFLLCFRTTIKWPERIVRRTIAKPLKAWLDIPSKNEMKVIPIDDVMMPAHEVNDESANHGVHCHGKK